MQIAEILVKSKTTNEAQYGSQQGNVKTISAFGLWVVIETNGMEDWRLYNFWPPQGKESHEFGGSANWASIEKTCKQYTPTEITEWYTNPEISYLALLLQFDERFGEADGGGGGESSHWPKFLDWKIGFLGGGTEKQWTLRFLQLKKTSGRFKSRSH